MSEEKRVCNFCEQEKEETFKFEYSDGEVIICNDCSEEKYQQFIESYYG